MSLKMHIECSGSGDHFLDLPIIEIFVSNEEFLSKEPCVSEAVERRYDGDKNFDFGAKSFVFLFWEGARVEEDMYVGVFEHSDFISAIEISVNCTISPFLHF